MKSAKIIVAAAALSGLLAGTQAGAAIGSYGNQKIADQVRAGQKAVTMDDQAEGKHACKGQNSCKGQGGCKTGDNGCRGKNSCKGHGGCKTNAVESKPQ
jgi:hypothetical protein